MAQLAVAPAESGRRMIRREHRDLAALDPAPQRCPVLWPPQRRAAHESRAIKSRQIQVALIEGQVLGAGLGMDRHAPGARSRDLGEPGRTGDMDDQDAGTGQLGQADHPIDGFALGQGRPRLRDGAPAGPAPADPGCTT